jgi:hypothetical protein
MRRIPAAIRALLALSAGWGISTLVMERAFHFLRFHVIDANGWYDMGGAVDTIGQWLRQSALDPLLFAASFLLPAALLVRMIARARVRAGLPDPLDRARRWAAARETLVRVTLATSALAWLALPVRRAAFSIFYHWSPTVAPAAVIFRRLGGAQGAFVELFVVAMAMGAFGVHAGLKRGLGAFLAPTLDAEESQASAGAGERVGFDAVAVTPETRIAVASMGVLSLAMVVAMLASRSGSTGAPVALASYIAVATAVVLGFRRASRITVGLDGVFVTGTSRSCFFAYNGLDGARARGSDIELFHGDRVVLKLQLHGEDATHKDAIVARIAGAIASARAQETAAVGEVVRGASEDQLARLAEGASGYRTQSVSREQLWSVIEGHEHGTETRTAAARALATTGRGDEKDRARLRVAAEKSAEPRVRVALGHLADEDPDASEDPNPPAAREPRAARG